MEIWDILDINGNKTGKTKIRGHKLNKSEYHLVIHVWIKKLRNLDCIIIFIQNTQSLYGRKILRPNIKIQLVSLA
jgi:hypothetical protein